MVGEAAFLGTPILSTETSSARELIEEPGLGLVCENSVEGLTKALQDILSAPEQLIVFSKNCRYAVYNNNVARSRFQDLIG